MTERAFARAWELAGEFVQACTYVVPAGFNPATGLTRSSETSLSLEAVIVALRPREWDLVVTQPGDERVLIRAQDLGAVLPVRGDYLVGPDGQRRDVQSARTVGAGLVWMLHCTANQWEDWGDLAAATSTEDRGSLATADTTEDWGTLT